MRHKRAGLHLSRTAAHRKSLFSNMVAALLKSEKIKTTEVKAKEIRRLTERAITWARRLGDILSKNPEKRSQEEKDRVLHAIRMALRIVRDRKAVTKLFEEIAPRYLNRHGGYTRITKMLPRPGDAAPMAILELVSSDNQDKKDKPEPSKENKGTAKAKKLKDSAEPSGDKPKKKTKPTVKKTTQK